MPASVDIVRLKEAYDRDGFVVIRNYLSDVEVKHLSERIEDVMGGHVFHSSFNGIRKDLDKADSWFRQEIEAGDHVSVIAALLLDKPTPSSVSYFDKPIGSSVEVSQHVDGMGKFEGATMWVALDVADSGNGCLCYVKGSHQVEHSKEAMMAFSEDSEGAVRVEAQPGDAVIHSAKTVHWSRKSTSTDRRRRAVSFFYWSSSCLQGLKSWPGKPKEEKPGEQGGDPGLSLESLDVKKALAALAALDRDWASAPWVAKMFQDDPVKFLTGLKPKDPEAYDLVVSQSRRQSRTGGERPFAELMCMMLASAGAGAAATLFWLRRRA